MVNRKSISRYIFFAALVLFSACKQQSRFHIESFDHPLQVEIQRFDLDFIHLDTTAITSSLNDLAQQYPDFYPLFIEHILGMDLEDSISNASQIRSFLSDSIFIEVHKKVTEVFTDIKTIEEELSVAFSYIQHYFPNQTLPKIYFFVSGFNQQELMSQDIIGFGTDLYLGADYPFYTSITHEYMIPNMRKELLVSDILSSYLHQIFPFQGRENVLDYMLYEGKILYLKSIFLPTSHEELLIGYSKDETAWCHQFEAEIWNNMVEHKYLFSGSRLHISQFIYPAPFTAPVSSESPGRLGSWTGWQIVKSYMQNNKELGLNDLMDENNYQAILEKSRYRP